MSGGDATNRDFRIYQTNVAPVIDSIRDTSITEGGYLKLYVVGRDYDFDHDTYPPRPKVTVDPATLPVNATFTGYLRISRRSNSGLILPSRGIMRSDSTRLTIR